MSADAAGVMSLQKKGSLSYDLSERAREVDLAELPKNAMLTENYMIKLEDFAKAARKKAANISAPLRPKACM